MINLLPPDSKQSITYARRNAMLLRTCAIIIGIITSIILLFGLGSLYIQSQTKQYQQEISTLQTSLKAQNLEGTKAEIQDLSGSVNLVLRVLASNILFSKVLDRAAAVMPAGSSLSNIEISSDQKGIDITAGVENYQVGTQVQVNLADKNNGLFDKVDLVSVNCDSTNTGAYPCVAKLRALFGDNSPYLFINNKAGQ